MINIAAAAASLYGYLFIPIAANISQLTVGEGGERPGQVATLSHRQCRDKQAHLDSQLLTFESHQLILMHVFGLWRPENPKRSTQAKGEHPNPKGGNRTYDVRVARQAVPEVICFRQKTEIGIYEKTRRKQRLFLLLHPHGDTNHWHFTVYMI